MPTENQGTPRTSFAPLKGMPSCWDQDERMNALFSPFRSKSANSQDWISKYKFWHDLIYEWLKSDMRCTFSIVDMNEAFKRKGCSPLCLKTVVEELIRSNEIVQEDQFLKEPCESWTSWSIDIFVKRPITWSFSKVKNYMVGQEINVETKYVHLQIVKELADIILTFVENKKENNLVAVSEILKHCKDKTNKEGIMENCVKLSLVWLKHTKRVAFRKNSIGNQNELLIKISKSHVDKISEAEEALYKLMKQENELIKEIELMEQQKINVINKAKSCLEKELREVAKTHLRKKMELTKQIQSKAQTLDNVQTLISNIQNIDSNSAVLDAYKASLNVLKKSTGSEVESNVKDTIADITEILEEVKDIQSALSESFDFNQSNADLERELEELMNSDNSAVLANSSLSSDIDNLENHLANLSVKDLPSPVATPLPLPTSRTKKKPAEPVSL